MTQNEIKEIVKTLTLQEKASLCSGKDMWRTKCIKDKDIPKMFVSDGPHGLRSQDSKKKGFNDSIVATCFPTGVGIAASFDRELIKELGEELAEEALSQKVGVVLGPAINIKRSPLCGRNFEYLSEDPYLVGEMATEYTLGMQSKGVGVSVKHFAVNSQENRRFTISAEVDERAMREIYFPGFEKVVKKAKPWTVMCAYNKINGKYCSENKWLTNDVLRDEWGFDGFVMTDWGAINNRVSGLESGIELEMPGSGGYNDNQIVLAVESGKLDEKILDRACERLLNIVFRSAELSKEVSEYDREKAHEKARKTAAETAVLLKNDGILPLDKNKTYAYIGEFAKAPRYQGGGSSHIKSYKVDSAWGASQNIDKVYAAGYEKGVNSTDELIEEAKKMAAGSDVAVVFAGLPLQYESEGFDRWSMDLPEAQNRLIEAVAEANPNTVVVLHNGSPVTMPWIDKVKGVLEMYLGGEAVGSATYDILFGDVNPSAKLAETFPLKMEDTPCYKYFPGYEKTVEYRESIYVGYRYYDTAKKEVLFPFGHGLSYSTFKYSNIKLEKDLKADNKVIVSFDIENTGNIAGKEICQVYVKDTESSIYRPEKELKGFEKIYLNPGEIKRIRIELDERAFAFYSVVDKTWVIEKGEFEILVGASSRNIRLSEKITLDGKNCISLDNRTNLPSYYSADITDVLDDEFSKLLGREISERNYPKEMIITEDHTLLDAQQTKWGRRIGALVKKFAGNTDLGDRKTAEEMGLQTTFRAIVNFSGGAMTHAMMSNLLNLINGIRPWSSGFKLFGQLFGIPFNVRKAKKGLLKK